MDAGAGSDSHDVPFQAKETGASGPTARQFLGPEHQTAFSCAMSVMPGWRARPAVSAAMAGALVVSGISAAMAAVPSTAATAPDLQLRTPDHHLLKSRPANVRTDSGRQ
jgi:hypothetical protein